MPSSRRGTGTIVLLFRKRRLTDDDLLGVLEAFRRARLAPQPGARGKSLRRATRRSTSSRTFSMTMATRSARSATARAAWHHRHELRAAPARRVDAVLDGDSCAGRRYLVLQHEGRARRDAEAAGRADPGPRYQARRHVRLWRLRAQGTIVLRAIRAARSEHRILRSFSIRCQASPRSTSGAGATRM